MQIIGVLRPVNQCGYIRASYDAKVEKSRLESVGKGQRQVFAMDNQYPSSRGPPFFTGVEMLTQIWE